MKSNSNPPEAIKNIPVIPADHWFFRNSLVVLKDPLAFFIKTFEEFGDIYDVNSNLFTIYVVAHPDYIQEIMVNNKTDYGKSDNYKVLKLSLGNGLLTSEGEFWKKQRRIAQPAFHRESMKNLLDTMIQSTQTMVDDWASKAEIELTDEMNFLTLDIVSKSLFGTTVDQENYKKIQESISIGNEYISEKIMKPLTWPVWVPTKKTLRYKKSRKFNAEVILEIINNRKKNPNAHQDMLSMLMLAEDEDTGERMSDQQLKDECLTIFVAGHETTANALSWALYLLSEHPDKMQKLKAEIQAVLGDGLPTFQNLKDLKYTQMVLEEAMRIYPPAWSIGRKVIQDTVMCGYEMKKKAQLLIDVYTLHRHPDFWERPFEFEPERFSPERKKQRHKYAYIPFGAGQRICIGINFAMMEMKVVLAMILQKYDLKLAKDAPEVKPETLVTLRPLNGIKMDLTK